MADIITQPKTVKALFNFKGKNNDELCFNKADVITLTQQIEGGWWEGTLGSKTGWFPSNYVKEVKPDGRAGAISPTSQPDDLPMDKRESMLFYHNVVLKSLIDSERTLVTELQTLLQTYLRPIRATNVISPLEYKQLVGNLEEIAVLHQALLSSLDECAKLPVHQQTIGGIFLKAAAQLKALYHTYCANHPRAASVLQHRQEELGKFVETKGSSSMMALTTNLSKPFTRLDKYPSVLKELERHTDESHIDRGDTQRAISVYRDIAVSCTETRKQKVMEYEIMNSTIKEWEGEDVDKLGDVILMAQVRVHQDNGERKERLLLLFPGLLVVLSISPRMSGYVYEGKFPVSGLTVEPLEENDSHKCAFEITGSLIDHRVVSCSSKSEQMQWVEALRQQAKVGPTHLPAKPQSLQISSSQPSISMVTKARTAQVLSTNLPYKVHKTTWTTSCLRPCPPLRPVLIAREDPTKSPKVSRKGSFRKKPPERAHSEDDKHLYRRIDDAKTLEDDALLLKVIESYCTSAKTRHTVNSSLLDSPRLMIAEEEKIIIEEMKGDQTVVEEKTLVDTVYSLKDQLKDMKLEQQKLRKDLEDEKRARKRLENLIRKPISKSVDMSIYDEGSPA